MDILLHHHACYVEGFLTEHEMVLQFTIVMVSCVLKVSGSVCSLKCFFVCLQLLSSSITSTTYLVTYFDYILAILCHQQCTMPYSACLQYDEQLVYDYDSVTA